MIELEVNKIYNSIDYLTYYQIVLKDKYGQVILSDSLDDVGQSKKEVMENVKSILYDKGFIFKTVSETNNKKRKRGE